jgi:hypothetical protein
MIIMIISENLIAIKVDTVSLCSFTKKAITVYILKYKCEILMGTKTQCCGSVMFEFGFGSDRGKVLIPDPNLEPNPDHI